MGKIGVGKHKVAVIGTWLGETKSGEMFIGISFGDPNGDTIDCQKYTSDNAWAYTERDLITLGWNPEQNGYAFEQFAADPCPILGTEVTITVAEEDYKGKRSVKVKYIGKAGVTAEQASSLAAQLRARLLARPGASTALPAGQPDKVSF